MEQKIELPTYQQNDSEETSNQIIQDTSPWNFRIKLLLKKIGEKSMGYRWMHEKESMNYETKDYWIGLLELFLGAMITTLTSGTLVGLFADTNLRNNPETIVSLTMIELIFALILSVTIGIKEHSDFRSKQIDHKNTAYKFTQLYHSIQEQFSINLEEREKDNIFLRLKIQEYDSLMENSLNISKQILNKYIEASKNYDIYKPAILGHFDNIEITDDAHGTVNINIQEDTKLDNYEFNRWMKNF